MAEHQDSLFVVEYTPIKIDSIRSQFQTLERFVQRVARPLWDFDKPPLTSINDVPFDAPDDQYGIAYQIGKEYLSLEFNSSHVLVSHSFEIDHMIFSPQVMKILSEVGSISDAVVCGYEIDLFLDDLDTNLNELVQDRSLYPIYLKSRRGIPPVVSKDRYLEFYIFAHDSRADNGRKRRIERYIQLLNL